MGATAAIGASAGASLLGYMNQKNTASYNQAVANANASMLEQQAIRVQEQADQQATDFRKQVSRTVGSQRAALAAQGVEVNDGSAIEIQQETEILGKQDALKIQTNGYLEALGIKTQAQNMRNQAAMNTQAVKASLVPSLLGAGVQGYMNSGGFNTGSRAPASVPSSPQATATAGSSYRNYGNLA